MGIQEPRSDGRQHRVGPYRLVGELGSGGMGTVYLAEQIEPVERKVALKLIKAGMDSEQVLARFESERQALALMDHANVARVYDAGQTETGRSYFAMEYVPGREITEHCDRAGLGFRDRVRLFLQVCDGVQHAHQKGLIHRDLKPSNILVKSSLDEPATVKIIDFGVAKSMQRKLTAQAAHTQLGTFVGTPIYSSPEQIMGRFVETDTRSDLYSLGVVLYELLVGSPPHGLDDFEGKTQQELVEMLSEKPPTSPIERFTTSVDAATVAAHRSLTVEQMQRRLRGDVSWVLLKCLERRPEDRYSSVSELRKELERWLDGLPLEARPATGLYHLQKLVRRHRTAVTVTALVTLALLTTTAAAVIGFVRAERAAEEAELATAFQIEQLREIDPAVMGIGLRSNLLEEIRRRLGEKTLEPAATEADLQTLESLLRGTNFTDLSLSLLDEHIFERAEAAIEEKYGDTPRLQARLWQSIADIRRELGQYDGAVQPQERALELRRRELGPEHPSSLESLRTRGQLRLQMGHLDDAEADLREATEVSRRVLGDEHPETLKSISALGVLFSSRGQLDQAEAHYREALETRRRVLGDEHRDTLVSIGNQAASLYSQGKFDEAERFVREVLEARRRVLGDEHPDTLQAISDLGTILSSLGEDEESERYHREVLEIQRRVLGDQHPKTLITINNLGTLLYSQGKLDEVETYYRDALEARRKVLGDEHPDTLSSLSNLGTVLYDQGKLEAAEPYVREALAAFRRVLGDEHPETLRSINNMGVLLHAQGKLADAEPYLLEALRGNRRVHGDEHPNTLYLTKNLARWLNERSRHAEAVELMRETLPVVVGTFGEDHALTAEARSVLGEALAGVGGDVEAETNLLRGYEILDTTLRGPKRLAKLRQAGERLVDFYEARDAPTRATVWRSTLQALGSTADPRTDD